MYEAVAGSAQLGTTRTLWWLEELLGPTGGGFCVVVIVRASLDAVPGMPRGVWALG